jgi:hypothetical protein
MPFRTDQAEPLHSGVLHILVHTIDMHTLYRVRKIKNKLLPRFSFCRFIYFAFFSSLVFTLL